MNKNDSGPDELAGTEQPFVTHLVELRDRLVRAVLAIVVCFGLLAIWPSPGVLYDWLAAPLVAHLPQGATLIWLTTFPETRFSSDATRWGRSIRFMVEQ